MGRGGRRRRRGPPRSVGLVGGDERVEEHERVVGDESVGRTRPPPTLSPRESAGVQSGCGAVQYQSRGAISFRSTRKRNYADRPAGPCPGAWPLTRLRRTVAAWRSSPCHSRTTSSSRPSATAPSGSTWRTSGTRAGCTASSTGARCGSRPRRAASTSSRSTTRPAGGRSRCSGRFRARAVLASPTRGARPASSRGLGASGRRSRPTRSRCSSARSPRSRSRCFAAFAVRNRLIEAFGERAESRTRSRRRSGSPARTRTSCSRSASRAARPSTCSRSPAPTRLGRARAPAGRRGQGAIVARRGIGEWTADWFLARHLGRPRGWPAGDLALRKAVSDFYGPGRMLSTEEVRAIGSRFDPFQNLTAHYLLLGHRMPA